MKYRVKFTKGEEIKFIGHLDILKLFQRAIKRAGLPIDYSKGFNPHQLISFANPLNLGFTSLGEYCDMVMKEDIEPKDIISRLNEVMPDGIEILNAVRLSETADNAMASVMAAQYTVRPDDKLSLENLDENIKAFMGQQTIMAEKKTKNNLKQTDIKPDIFKFENISKDGNVILRFFLAAGSLRSVKAELVLKSFYEFLNLEFDRYKMRYCRDDLFRLQDGKYLPLDEGDIVI